MRSYRVNFFLNGKSSESGKSGRESLGSIIVDVKPNDTLTLQCKAFRQASPSMQIANRIEIHDLGPWGAKGQMQKMHVNSGRINNADDRGFDAEAGSKIVASMTEDLGVPSGDTTLVQTIGPKGVDAVHKTKAPLATAPISDARKAHLEEMKAELKYKPKLDRWA
jgi:hypothetical protein